MKRETTTEILQDWKALKRPLPRGSDRRQSNKEVSVSRRSMERRIDDAIKLVEQSNNPHLPKKEMIAKLRSLK